MPGRMTITEVAQIGVETTPGTPVAANRRFTALSILPGIKADVVKFTPLGAKYTTVAALGKEWVEASIESRVACYNHLAYLFSGILQAVTPAQQGTTNAYLWTFTPSQTAEDTIRTYTVEVGSAVRAGRFAYGLLRELTMRFSREQIEVRGTMLGTQYTDGIAMTASPTVIATQPILPTQLDIFLDPTSAAIGTTRLTRAFSAEWIISDRYNPVWPINSTLTSFASHVELQPTVQLKILVEADAQGMGLLPVLRAGDRRYIRVRAVGPVISAPHTFMFQLDMAGLVTEVSEFSDEDGVLAIQWTFDAAFDAGWSGGRAFQVQLMNTLSGL